MHYLQAPSTQGILHDRSPLLTAISTRILQLSPTPLDSQNSRYHLGSSTCITIDTLIILNFLTKSPAIAMMIAVEEQTRYSQRPTSLFPNTKSRKRCMKKHIEDPSPVALGHYAKISLSKSIREGSPYIDTSGRLASSFMRSLSHCLVCSYQRFLNH